MSTNSPLAPLYSELNNRFPGHLSGSPEGHFVVISENNLSDQAYRALSASAIADDFGCFSFGPFPAPNIKGTVDDTNETQGPLTLVTLAAQHLSNEEGNPLASTQASVSPPTNNECANDSLQTDEDNEGSPRNEDVSRETFLSPANLILTIETLDPLAVISVDMASAKALADAYRTQIKLNTPQTLLGRPLRCFENFDSMISTNEGKRNAWKLLKNVSLDRP